MKSNKYKIAVISIPTILFIIFAMVMKWLPGFVDENIRLAIPLEQRVSASERVIDKLESSNEIDKPRLIKMFKSGIALEQSTEDSIDSIIQLLQLIASAFIGLLILYLACVMFVFQAPTKKKT